MSVTTCAHRRAWFSRRGAKERSHLCLSAENRMVPTIAFHFSVAQYPRLALRVTLRPLISTEILRNLPSMALLSGI